MGGGHLLRCPFMWVGLGCHFWKTNVHWYMLQISEKPSKIKQSVAYTSEHPSFTSGYRVCKRSHDLILHHWCKVIKKNRVPAYVTPALPFCSHIHKWNAFKCQKYVALLKLIVINIVLFGSFLAVSLFEVPSEQPEEQLWRGKTTLKYTEQKL